MDKQTQPAIGSQQSGEARGGGRGRVGVVRSFVAARAAELKAHSALLQSTAAAAGGGERVQPAWTLVS